MMIPMFAVVLVIVPNTTASLLHLIQSVVVEARSTIHYNVSYSFFSQDKKS